MNRSLSTRIKKLEDRSVAKSEFADRIERHKQNYEYQMRKKGLEPYGPAIPNEILPDQFQQAELNKKPGVEGIIAHMRRAQWLLDNGYSSNGTPLKSLAAQ